MNKTHCRSCGGPLPAIGQRCEYCDCIIPARVVEYVEPISMLDAAVKVMMIQQKARMEGLLLTGVMG